MAHGECRRISNEFKLIERKLCSKPLREPENYKERRKDDRRLFKCNKRKQERSEREGEESRCIDVGMMLKNSIKRLSV